MSNSQTLTAASASNSTLRQAYILLVVGILAVSLAAIFIRYALDEGVPSIVIAAARLVIAALILTPFTLLRHRDALRRLTRSDWLFAAASSLMLALHFASWVSSLEGSSVLISVTLVTTGTLWVALLEFM
ncbi:MAG: EamA family transporter, partial [Burkholderiales bacterium]|nr:EamA family transporter [Anaerolineae bacterium]